MQNNPTYNDIINRIEEHYNTFSFTTNTNIESGTTSLSSGNILFVLEN